MFNDGDNFQPSSVNINNNSDVVPPPRPPPPPEHQQQSNHFRPRLHIFNGHDKSVTIENWLKLYESTANRYNWSYDEKIDLLAEYLDKDALNTYISARDSGDWITIKNKLITRFGVRSIRPSVEFCRLKFNHVKNVDEYFESKKRLAGLAGFTETQAVELMIDHLSDELNRCFLGHQVNTYCEFYTIAKTAEQQLPRNDNNNNNNNQNKNRQVFHRNKQFNYHREGNNNNNNQQVVKKQPKGACYRCIANGKPNQFHWSSDCPLRKDNYHQPKVNFVDCISQPPPSSSSSFSQPSSSSSQPHHPFNQEPPTN